ncbi:putative c2h2 zinc finger protein [Phaeoacremonium minimum UCRPA7]|uniref:Putative c2h2 zinc finger protein n=1 Tax=Phaeoacremonium minimum (strain UCR-PA7) TaxID=1286976 RepID=R8BIU3_PHAM7|nr:putative c2h2 zinc finger protein [Phaeoacremonium minimum UCRPA7]EON99199.1 putative c2h2 zinc finger protein [Phaeoacremonium minimum UCRPA7]
MGNSNTRESRPGEAGHRGHRSSIAPSLDPSLTPTNTHQSDRPASRARNRASRGDIGSLLGIGGSSASPASATGSHPDPPYERRETKQEREARRLERERVARIKERERSIKEEHVDGGYLVTLGTYTGPEDFNKQVVRQLQIERKIAPFWRGINDVDESWAEHQIIAAARGLPIPAADEAPPEDLIPRPLSSSESPAGSTQNLNNLTVPMGGRTLSAASDRSLSNVGSALPSPTSAAPARTSSPFKPRAKALAAALTGSSRNASSTDIAPREINLPNDPFVNGQPLEVYLYKNASECPICFLYYPPYLNHTRCCDQPICSECFVQIKRPDPHYPEGHGDGENPAANPEETAGQLISEPAQCPYCQQPEFGVTYEPPPFRRGITYSISTSALGAMNTAMSSSSSLNSASLSPTSAGASPPALAPITGSRRRTQSLSANAPNVITTDRVRPDWATKLASQRAHQARRAAAATALHTAAFLMGSSESRSFRVSRFSRRNTGNASSANNNAESPTGNANDSGSATPSGPEPGPRGSSGRLLVGPGGERRRSHMEDLENMMFMEAIRLSLAAEEERKRKAEKEERKEAKKREKEERKAAKAAAKHAAASGGPYNPSGGSGHSSASGSSLSLPGLGAIGRRRGNSAASNLRMEASVANAMASTGASGSSSPGGGASSPADKGKGVDRGPTQTAPETEVGAVNVDSLHPATVSTTSPTPATTASPRPIPSPHQPAGPSHLRQMSSASSISSSLPDSQPGSYQNPSHLQDPRASGLSFGSQASEDGEQARHQEHDRDPSASTEPMFNFRSLAEMVGVEIEGENAGRRLSQIGNMSGSPPKGDDASNSPSDTVDKSDEASAAAHEHVEHVEDDMDKSFSTLTPATANGQVGHSATSGENTEGEASQEKHSNTLSLAPPTVMVTPETPAPEESGAESKQLGYEGTETREIPSHVTQ